MILLAGKTQYRNVMKFVIYLAITKKSWKLFSPRNHADDIDPYYRIVNPLTMPLLSPHITLIHTREN